MGDEPGEAASGTIMESLKVPGGGSRLHFVGNGGPVSTFFDGRGRQNNDSERCPYSRTYEFATLHGKRVRVDVSKLRILRWEGYPGLSG